MEPFLPDISTRLRWAGFIIILALVLGAYAAYGINMVSWKDATDYGWRAMYDSGPNVVDEVFGRGWQSGLRPGDRVLFINGRSYDTFNELFFQIRNTVPGEVNVYSVLRDDRTVDLNITNGVLGFSAVVKRSGPLFLVGLLYVFIGVLVFLMKPGARESRVFLLMTSSLGVSISYASPSDLMHPLSLFQLRQFFDVFLPAPIIHLALIFPRRRDIMDPGRWFWPVPYLVSLAIFLFFRPFSAPYWDPPAHMDLVNNLYLLTAVILFIISTASNFRKGISPLVRVQSRMVFFGILIGFFIPVAELLARNIGDLHLFSDPAVSFALLFSAFPLCVGYTIVRHDLFAIDTAVRRTFGYALSTAAIVTIYAMVVVVLNLSIPSADIARSQVFTAFFAIAVVIAFKPLHEKVQRLVDRRFYRVKLDYKGTVTSISNDLTTFFNRDEIIVRILHAVRDIMAIDSAGIILLDPEEEECQTRFIHDGPGVNGQEEYSDDCLDLDYPLAALMKQKKKVLTIYELEEISELKEDPESVSLKNACIENFKALRAVVALPLVYRNEVKGVLALGRKKSGRFYAREDIDLLKTLANQGAIAIENARLAEKMKDEEVVRASLSRYLAPEVVDQVILEARGRDMGGDRKNVAVLISDIRGFTELTRTQPPDRLVGILNEYRTEMVHLIFKHEGSLDKYVGDAIVAVFGGHVFLENPTSNAVKTAIDMVNKVARLNEKWEGQYDGFHMEVGFGVDTGEVFVGNVGSPERLEFTVIGEAVNTAANLSNLAKPNQILLSEGASAALGGNVDVRELGDVKNKHGDSKILEVVR